MVCLRLPRSLRARPRAVSKPSASPTTTRWRGSHRFFKRYGDKFEDSEGKKIFLEFADEERAHLELLIREYRALVLRQRRRRPARAAKRRARREPAALS